jgi:cell division protein FtsW
MPQKLKPDWVLFVATLALVLVGSIMVFSSSAVLASDSFGNPNHFSFRHLVSVALGLGGMFILMRVNYTYYRQPAVVFSLLSIVTFLLIFAYFLPMTANTHRWIKFAGLSFQPAELAKLSIIVFMAYFLEKRKDRINDFRFTLVPIGVVTLVIAGLIYLQPDLGTAVAIAAVVGLLLFTAGLKFRWIALAAVSVVPVFYFVVYQVPWRRARLFAFMDPWADPLDSGWQIIQSLTALGSGGITGVGLMEGQQKLFYLPEPHTDLIFAVVGEELGLIGTIAILFLFVVFMWRGLRTSLRAPDLLGAYLALGITMMVALQAFFNMSVVLGLLPTKGIPLPFLSYGGSSFLIMLAGVGILMNVSQRGS